MNKKLNGMSQKTKRQSGFTLVEAVLSVAILLTSFLALGMFTNSSIAMDQKFKAQNNLLSIRIDLISHLSNPRIWAKMVTESGPGNNASLECLRTGAACATTEEELVVTRDDGTSLANVTASTEGFTADGGACNTFSTTSTDTANPCQYQYRVTWKPICPVAGPCQRPQVNTKVSLVSNVPTEGKSIVSQTSSVSVTIEQTFGFPAFARRATAYANSSIYFPTETSTYIMPLTSVTSVNDIEIPAFSTPIKSSAGGTVDWVFSKKIHYTPKPGFYGLDTFTYEFRDVVTSRVSRGTVAVRVMTPYTWTGFAGAWDSSSTNIRNFCGKVIFGWCDGATFPVPGPDEAGVHYVFNANCDHCDATLESPDSNPLVINSVEMDATYQGTVKLVTAAQIKESRGPWHKPVNLLIKGGTFDASASPRLDVYAADRGLAYTPPPLEDYAVKVTGAGILKAPAALVVQGSFYTDTWTNFSHQNGITYLYGIANRPSSIYSPTVVFHKLYFGSPDPAFRPPAGTESGYDLSSDLVVVNDLGYYPLGSEDFRISNGKNPGSNNYINYRPTLRFKGDLYIGGSGGSRCTASGPNSCLPPYFMVAGGQDQTIHGVDASTFTDDRASMAVLPTLPSLAFQKVGGFATMNGAIPISGNFVALALPDGYDFSSSKLMFNNKSCLESLFITGPATEYGDIYDMRSGCASGLNLGASNINVHGNYYHYAMDDAEVYGSGPRSAHVKLDRDFVIDGQYGTTTLANAAEVEFVGTAAQEIRRPYNRGVSTLHWKINNTSGPVTMAGDIGTVADVEVTAGNLVAAPSSKLFIPPHANATKTVLRAPATVFETLQIAHETELASDISAKDLVLGTAASTSGLDTKTYQVAVLNDLTLVKDPNVRTNKIVFSGTNLQNFSFADPTYGATFANTNVLIDKASGNVSYSGSGQLGRVCVKTMGLILDPTSTLNGSSFESWSAGYFTPTTATYGFGSFDTSASSCSF